MRQFSLACDFWSELIYEEFEMGTEITDFREFGILSAADMISVWGSRN